MLRLRKQPEIFGNWLKRQPARICVFALADFANGAWEDSGCIRHVLTNAVTACAKFLYNRFKEIITHGAKREYEPSSVQWQGK